MRLGGAVLVGGASRRMGVDKATLALDGVAMGRRVADALQGAGCDPVMAIGADVIQLDVLGLPGVPDEHPGQGPLGGCITALRTFDETVDLVVVAACDLPWLDADTVTAVVAALAHGDGSLATAGGRSAMCLALRRDVVAHLVHAFDNGERALFAALGGLRMTGVEVSPTALRNVNSPVDLTVK